MGGFSSGVQQGQPSNAGNGKGLGGDPTPIKPSGGAAIDGLYQSVLGRAPDQGGADYWRQQFGNTIDDNECQIFQNSAQAELQGRAQQPQGMPPVGSGGGKGGQQLQGMQGASTNSATSGQPTMGAPNKYPNTVGQWDNTQIKPTGQGGKGKGV